MSPAIYDNVDVRFNWSGDFNLKNGDLEDCSSDTLLSLKEQLNIICSSSLGDWELYPNRGANLDDFIGEPNTRNTASRIKSRLQLAILSTGLITDSDLSIKIIPVSKYALMTIINVNCMSTPFNKLRENENLIVSFVFDTVEQNIYFLDKNAELI